MQSPSAKAEGELFSSLLDYLKRIPDPRSGKRIKHDCAEVLACLVLGFCAGRTTIDHAMKWCEHNIDVLKKHMGLKNGIASDSTAWRILSGTDVSDMSDVFTQWAGHLVKIKGACLVFDGKGMRASARKMHGERTPYVMNVIENETKLCTAVVPVGEKENEKAAFHRILDSLDMEGTFVLADAMATDSKIMGHLQENGAHFFFQVKKNNPETYRQLTEQMGALQEEIGKIKKDNTYKSVYEDAIKSYSYFENNEKNRERWEYRRCYTTNDVGLLDRSRTDLCFLKTIGVVKQARVPIEWDADGNDVTPGYKDFLKNGSRTNPNPAEGDGIKDDITTVGIVSDVELDSETSLGAKRAYWSIENKLHYVLDNVLLEDRCTAKNSKNQFSIIRRFAYNVLRTIQIREGFPENNMKDVAYAFCDNAPNYIEYVLGCMAGFA